VAKFQKGAKVHRVAGVQMGGGGVSKQMRARVQKTWPMARVQMEAKVRVQGPEGWPGSKVQKGGQSPERG
jgi:hypothetical protein